MADHVDCYSSFVDEFDGAVEWNGTPRLNSGDDDCDRLSSRRQFLLALSNEECDPIRNGPLSVVLFLQSFTKCVFVTLFGVERIIHENPFLMVFLRKARSTSLIQIHTRTHPLRSRPVPPQEPTPVDS